MGEKREFTYAVVQGGIGGASIALNKLGGKAKFVWQQDFGTGNVEEIIQAHNLLFPKINVRGDIFEENLNELSPVDFVVITPPIYAYHAQQGQEEMEQNRGQFLSQVIHVLKHLQPKAFFMENIKGLVTRRGGKSLKKYIERVSELGYCVDFNYLNAQYFNTGQSRSRLYVVGVQKDLTERTGWVLLETQDRVIREAKEMWQAEKGFATFNFDWDTSKKVKCTIQDVLEPSVDEKYFIEKKLSRKLINVLNEQGEPLNEKAMKRVGLISLNGQQYYKRVYSIYGVSRTLNTEGGTKGGGVKIALPSEEGYRIRILTARESLRLQGFPNRSIDKLENHFLESTCYRFAGESVCIPVIAALAKRLLVYI